MARLPDRYRLPVLLCLVEGLTHPAAAARLGWPVGTVAGRLSRAKALLRDRLTRRGVTAGLTVAPLAGGGWVSATATAASSFAAGGAAGVSPSVLHLAKGLVRAMTVTKWATAAGLFLAAAAVTGGGLVAGGQQPLAEKGLTFVVQPRPVPGPPLQVEPTKPNPGKPEDAARRADYAQRQRSEQTLRRILLAMHNYESANGHFPNDLRANSGKPLLSWRVVILPYLFPPGTDPAGQPPLDGLYRQFNLDEPWDGPTNKPLLAQMPDVFRVRFQPKTVTNTYYQGFAGVGTVFEPGQKIGINQITDGMSNTLAVAEVGPPVPWTQPADVPYDQGKPFPTVAWPFGNLINVAHADGSTHQYAPAVPELYLRQTLSRAGGEMNQDEGKFKPRLTAETPEEKAELAKLQAEATRLLGEVGRLVPATNAPEDVAEVSRALKELLDRLKPPAK